MSFLLSADQKSGWLVDNSNMVLHRNYVKFMDPESQKNYSVNSINENELLASYGAQSKNLQYITEAEGKFYGLTDTYVENYNMFLPHYQYAYALFNTPISTFFYKAQRPAEGV